MMKWSYWLGHTFFRAMGHACFGFHVKNRHKLLETGGVLLVANHQSFLDPPLIGSIFDDGVYFLARKTLFKGIMKPIYNSWQAIPVDQDGPDMTSLKKIIQLLKQGERVLIFPEGSRTPDGEIKTAMPGIGFILHKANVPVQPVRIFGAFEALPIHGKFKLAPISVTIGDPIQLSEEERKLKGKAAYQAMANKAMEAIAALTP